MKNVSLLLFTAFIMAFAFPAHAAYVIKKPAPVKAQKASSLVAAENNAAYEAPVAAEPSKEEIASAVDEFRNLPRAERQERIREARDEFNKFRHSDTRDGEINTLLLVIIAILLPPLAVGLYEHGLTSRFWIDLLLWLLFYIPGLIYALIVIL